jgi:hypothetical protein
MQEVSRHAIHVGEVLGVTEDVLQTMLRQQCGVYNTLSKTLTRTHREQMQEYSRFQIHVLQALKGRSDSNVARLQNEITLVGNLLNVFPTLVSDFALFHG